jgi:hypothetical protein
MNNVGTSYVLWLGCLLQLHGLHRLYNGKIVTGLLWMFTLGLFGVGQFLDLLWIPSMVEEHNAKVRSRLGDLPNASNYAPVIEQVILRGLTPSNSHLETNQLVMQLLKVAETKGGKISVTQGVMATGASFVEVETTLKNLLRTGYVDITNDSETGIVMYEFKEL